MKPHLLIFLLSILFSCRTVEKTAFSNTAQSTESESEFGSSIDFSGSDSSARHIQFGDKRLSKDSVYVKTTEIIDFVTVSPSVSIQFDSSGKHGIAALPK
jgi:hypothetical protein